MNDGMKLLSMLLGYAQRHMVVSLGLIQAHFVGDAAAARGVIAQLSRQGLVYVEGPSVRLTLLGFARAVAASRETQGTVHDLGHRSRSPRSRAA